MRLEPLNPYYDGLPVISERPDEGGSAMKNGWNLKEQIEQWRANRNNEELPVLGERPDDGECYELATLFLGGHGYWYCGGWCNVWHRDRGVDYEWNINRGWLGGVEYAESLLAAGEKKPEEIVPLSYPGKVAPTEEWEVR